MAVNWGIQQFQPNTPLNLQPGIQNFFAAQQNKRANSLADLELDKQAKKQKADAIFNDIMAANTGPDGTQNRAGIRQGLAQTQNWRRAMEMEKFWQGQDKQAAEAQRAQAAEQRKVFEQRQLEVDRIGELARGVTTSDDPVKAFRSFQTMAIDENLPINQALKEYQANPDDPFLDPNLVSELNLMGQASGKAGMQARVRTVYANGKVWLQDQEGNITPARDPKTGNQLAQSDTYKTVMGENEIYSQSSKTGELKPTGIKPKGAAKAQADLAETIQETEIEGEKWLEQKDKNIQAHKTTKLKHKANIDKFSRFSNKARRIASNPNLKFTTGGGRFHPTKGSKVPGIATPGKDLVADIDNLIAMGAINTMIQLKAESRTGSTGFGALSAPELKILQDAIGSIGNDEISVNKKISILTEVAEIVDRYVENIEGFETEYNVNLPETEEEKEAELINRMRRKR